MFIFAHADITFAVCKTLLNPPAQGGGLRQFGKRHLFGGIGERIFGLPVGGASDQQPDGFFMGQPLVCGKDPQAGDVRKDRAFGIVKGDVRSNANYYRQGTWRYNFESCETA